MMTRDELVETFATSLLWEVVSSHVEQLNELPKMIGDIGYLKDVDGIISETTGCEIFDSESFDIIKFSAEDGKIIVNFEMPFIMSTWNNEKQLLRITSTATGTCAIPDINKFNWKNYDFDEMRKDELLAMQHIVEVLELEYCDSECDDVSIL